MCEGDAARVLDVLTRVGFRTEATFPHWLSKAHADGHFIDVIFNSGNGEVPVDREWFDNALPAEVFGVPVAVCPAEETIWSKGFVMERERFDGADVAHLLLACASTLDWHRLLRRFGGHARVLFAHLVLFGYVFPGETERIPRWVMDELSARVQGDVSDDARMCRGTMLSREQYLPDLTRGWRDARLPPTGSMSTEAIALWTEAIEPALKRAGMVLVGAAAEARRVVVVRERVRGRPVVAAVAVEVGIQVVAALERPLRVVDPLVEVADHVEDPERVRAVGALAGARERPRELIQPGIDHVAAVTPHPAVLGFAVQTRVEEAHRAAPVVVAAADHPHVAIRERGPFAGPCTRSSIRRPYRGAFRCARTRPAPEAH